MKQAPGDDESLLRKLHGVVRLMTSADLWRLNDRRDGRRYVLSFPHGWETSSVFYGSARPPSYSQLLSRTRLVCSSHWPGLAGCHGFLITSALGIARVFFLIGRTDVALIE